MNESIRRKRITAVNFLLGCILLTAGLQIADAKVEKGTLWRDAVKTDLDVDFDGTGFHARWQYHRCHCGDLLIQVEQTAPDGVFTGELLLVDGQVLLKRGFDEQGEDIAPLIQAPSLMLQLVYELLNRAEPKGPFAVAEKQQWDVEEDEKDFVLNTGLASGTFNAPWSVKGSAWRTDSGRRRFELSFQFFVAAEEGSMHQSLITFSGSLDYRKQGFPYPEATSLEGWRMQWLSLSESKSQAVPEGVILKSLRQEAKGR